MEAATTLDWSARQSGVQDKGLVMTRPVAQGAGGQSREEAIFDKDAPTGTLALTWPSADMGQAQASLTIRLSPDAPRATAPGS